MIEFILVVAGLVTLSLVVIVVIVDQNEREMNDAFPLSRRREKARMMREEWENE